jgi:hypothetical protein
VLRAADLSAVEATSALFMPMTVLSLPMAALAGFVTDRHAAECTSPPARAA